MAPRDNVCLVPTRTFDPSPLRGGFFAHSGALLRISGVTRHTLHFSPAGTYSTGV